MGCVALGSAGNASVLSDLSGECPPPAGWVGMVWDEEAEGEVIPPGSPFVFLFEQSEVSYR